MAGLLTFLIVAGGFAAILGAFVWLARRIRRSGAGSSLIGPLDEVYHPTAHRARYDIEVQEERQAPLPSPDDQLRRIRRRRSGDQEQ